MEFINRKTHAILDYASVLILVAAPFWFFGCNAHPLYSIINGYSYFFNVFITDYEGGVLKLLNVSFHVTIDVIMGLVLTASP